ncbi:Degenerin-like protein unc-105 [Caenorhabditis elegans]|nr:Degenerin-like protein unc-105 [Caenorhabditis elegans]CCF23432.1 Degenerin-like protein unc-105 [Caenorhabditis elegans]|eukprot:NP_001254140.1 Degenerin-like protein unc-105 [Caenorhabditis elegans]
MENASSTAQLSIDIEDNGQAAQLPPQPPSRHHQWAQDQNRKNMSFEKSGHATRNASEDSKNIRFLGDHAPPSGARKRSHNKRLHDWRRRLSVNPELLRRHGLRNIRMNGHLDWNQLRKSFEKQSTFHGISHAATADGKWRWFWYTAFTICLLALLIQIFFLISKYRQYGKTVDLDLKFENAPFPSITICNLNPYKKSAIQSNPNTKAMMEAYSRRIGSGDKTEGIAAALSATGGLHAKVRRAKRKAKGKPRLRDRRYHQAFAQCLCDIEQLTGDRKGSCFAAFKGKIEIDTNNTAGFMNLHTSRCLCQLDTVSKALWPCFPYSSWKEKLCSECVDNTGHCPMRFYKGNELYENIKEQVDLCLCHKEYNHCVSTRDDGIILEISPNDELNDLDIGKKIASQLSAQQEKQAEVTTTEAPTVTQALGFEELTDDIAITSQAQENLMFAVGEMSEKAKESMSYELDELVLKCSFNQKDCQMDRDFTLHYDNTFGNCYTFNYNRTAEVASHRAGANYGLRVLLYANVSEYLPTTEAVGFRITVHDKHIVPFPDAFGYSAPTGFMSSFGVRMKQFIRLEPPYGHCRHGGEDAATFVYTGFQYSVEACHRSCAQKVIVEACGCADPMYPVAEMFGNNTKPCQAVNMDQRECLRNTTLWLGELYSKGKEAIIPDCYCHQPCQETNYEVTYSSARWPSGSAKVMECLPGDFLCLEKYRKNAAMVQIFYEELNYETMQESPAYTLTSVLADLGGLTGLWIGASVVSLLEIVTLIVFATQAYVRKRKGSISAQSHHSVPVHRASRVSLNTLHKSSTTQSVKLSVMDIRSIKSIHSNHSSKSKQSILIEDLPPAIQEQSDDEEETTESSRTNGSCRYLAPGEDLPCLCKYHPDGSIRIMKALCPVHGYMVRRNYDYSVSNSEEEDAEDEVHREPEPFYSAPYEHRKK